MKTNKRLISSWNATPYMCAYESLHDDVTRLKHFPRYWSFVRRIHRSPVNSPHKGQWRRASMFSLICVWINGWVNNHEAGDLRRHGAHLDVIVMEPITIVTEDAHRSRGEIGALHRQRVWIINHRAHWKYQILNYNADFDWIDCLKCWTN